MNYIEKQIDNVVNRTFDNLPFGDKDNITKENVYKVLDINNNSISKLKDANTILINALNEMLIKADLLTKEKKYYSFERRNMFLEFKKRVENVIENRRIHITNSNDEYELINLIKANIDTIYFYRKELLNILTTVKMPTKKHIILPILNSIIDIAKKQDKKNKQDRINEIIENAYLDPLEEEMLKKGEYMPSDFEDEEYEEEEDYFE